ncbi:MAG: hypothetical protein ACO1N4_08515 [Pedobacter sp.]
MQGKKNEKTTSVKTDQYFVYLIVFSVLISIIIAIFAILKKSKITNTLWADIPIRIIFFLICAIVIFYIQVLLITISYHLVKVIKESLKRFIVRKQYSLYFKRFDSMLPGESIDINNIENKEQFLKAANIYIDYKYVRWGILNTPKHQISSDQNTFYRH